MQQPALMPSVVALDTKALPGKVGPAAFIPPTLKPGEIGGYVVDRTDAQDVEKWSFKSTHVPFHVRHFWSPRFGRVKPWFDIEIQGPGGITIISLAEKYIYELRLGDWITVHKFVQDNQFAIAKRVTILKVPHASILMDIDIHWIGPATECAGEGKIGRGFDAADRRVFFTWNAYKGHFGARIRKRNRKISTEPYEVNKAHALGGSFYSVLGLKPPPPQSTDEEVKKAYRDKSKEHHPDMNPGDAGASMRFQEVKDAFDMLVDKAARAIYDMFMQLSQQTYTANKKGGVGDVRLKVGKFKEAWYPPVTSGKVKCMATLVGITVLVDKIEEITVEELGIKTRICVPVDGLPTLLWGLNV